ncbi:MAG TPA: YggS family pyridoxal phosphate-dependent enzyme [Actinomycetota bacterium]|nr:YggS family pyridoxal phosphate-dependent enzyme [Actinomycetota bacterium]
MARVRDRVAGAARRAGRRADEVRLIGITKGVAGEVVAMAAGAGLEEFGENYVQELVAKRAQAPDATWHFVGRLQRNKVHRLLGNADVVQTLEPGAAADRLARMAEERPVECLVEVDFTGRRVGVAPDEAPAFVERMAARPGVRVRGLMTVAPPEEDPRKAFAELRELRDRLRERFEDVRELSMGMSADLEAAVEEGATMVRVGTAIFGPREVEGR